MSRTKHIPTTEQKSTFVNHMFARIAPTYDVMNRLMTLGQDQSWRRILLEYCDLPPRGLLLDVGTGTGDIAHAATQRYLGCQVHATDFTHEMMAAGKDKFPSQASPFTQSDALALPYPDNTFDAVVSGFLIRNVVDLPTAFREQVRVIKPGGRVICLETAPPNNAVLSPLFKLYFFKVVPLLGGVISGDSQAYNYLPHSTVEFPPPELLKMRMEEAGLRNVFYDEHMLGSVSIHVGTKIG